MCDWRPPVRRLLRPPCTAFESLPRGPRQATIYGLQLSVRFLQADWFAVHPQPGILSVDINRLYGDHTSGKMPFTMPKRPLNPFAANNSSTAPTNHDSSTYNEKFEMPRRASSPRTTKFPNLNPFSPKSKNEPQTATAALLAAAQQQGHVNLPTQRVSSPTLSLPTISLSTAKADSANLDEPPRTLFQAAFSSRSSKDRKATCSIWSSGSLFTQIHQSSCRQ